jgi:hypothetical protein
VLKWRSRSARTCSAGLRADRRPYQVIRVRRRRTGATHTIARGSHPGWPFLSGGLSRQQCRTAGDTGLQKYAPIKQPVAGHRFMLEFRHEIPHSWLFFGQY